MRDKEAHYTRQDQLNIESCIRRRGTIEQRRALKRWGKTTGYIVSRNQFDTIEKYYEKRLNKLRNNISFLKDFLHHNGLLVAFEDSYGMVYEKDE